MATSISLLAALLAVAVVQRLPIWHARLLLPLAAFGLAISAVLWGLGQLPPDVAASGMGLAGSLAIVTLVLVFLLAGAVKRVPVYEVFVEGAKEGFGVAVNIIPYLVAMLVAISVFRAAGCMDYVMGAIGSGVAALGWNTDFLPALPVGLMKILSGSGARGLMVDVMQTHGVESFAGSWPRSSRARPRPPSTCWRCTSAAWA